MRIDTEKSIANQKLKVKKSLISQSLDFFLLALIYIIFIVFNFFNWYLILWKGLAISYAMISIISLAFIFWLAFGEKNKGKLYPIENLNLNDLQAWVNLKINSGEFKGRLDNEVPNGTSIRMNGLTFTTYARDLFILSDNQNIYISSVAIGKTGKISPTHYFSDKKINKALIQEIKKKVFNIIKPTS